MAKRRRRDPSPAPAAPSRRFWPVVALFVIVLAGLGLWLKMRGPAGPTAHPNVLLVTIDTLRADRLGCYGHASARTPALDALAARGVRFATAVAHAPLTTPSHASILTGLTPVRHGVRDNGGYVLPAGIPTLAEAFAAAGYRTAAFVSGFPLDRRFGLARGFETYDDRLPHGDDPRRAAYVERTAEATTALAWRWLEAAGSAPPRPWFAWVHYFDPHAPYEPPPDFKAGPANAPYDGEVAFVDAQIGSLLHRLETAGARERTLVLVTADHGESLGQHGEETHGVFLYDATLRVPWILAGPGMPAGRVATTVARGIDVAPTLLDLAGLPSLHAVEGRSLRPAANGKEMQDEPAYAESLFVRLHLGWAPLHAWRTARYKMIDAPRPELYDLTADAAETRDVTGDAPAVAEDLRRQLKRVLETETRAPAAEAALDSATAERLRALGYVGSGPVAEAAASLRDPKDGIALVNRLERAIAEARADPAGSARELAAVLAQDPRMALARRYRTIALAGAQDYEAALAEIRMLEREGPLSTDDLVLRAECLRLAGRLPDALQALDRLLRQGPRAPEPLLIRARILIALGQPAEAEAAYQGVLAFSPDHAAALSGLGDLALARGDLASAAAYHGRVLEADPGDAASMVKLGVTRVRSGQLEEAVSLFRQAVEREPSNAEALLALAGALAKGGRPAEAVPYFKRALEAGARSTVTLNGLGFAQLASGDEAGALVSLRGSLALDPRQPEVAEVVSQLRRGRPAGRPPAP